MRFIRVSLLSLCLFVTSLSVIYLSLRMPCMSQKPDAQTSPNFRCTLPVSVTRFFFWRRCDMLCTSGFVDDAMLGRNRPESTLIARMLKVTYHGAAPDWGAKLLPTIASFDMFQTTVYNCINVQLLLWRCWLGGRKGIRPVKNWAVGCWHGYLPGARCRLAYSPADATATHCLLLQ